MKDEYEVIEHPFITDLNVFLVNLDYRTPHMHEDIEVILVLEGQVTTKTQHNEYELGPDAVVLFNSNQLHEFHSVRESTLILCLQISPRFCARYYPLISQLRFDTPRIDQCLDENIRGYVKTVLVETAYHYYMKGPGYEFLCFSFLNQLFWILLNRFPYRILSEQEQKANNQKIDRLRRILNYIDDNYMNKILLSDIAKRENLSMAYLSHFFKDNLNQTFQEYVSNLRFSHAREMVMEKQMKFIDICMECGFSDYRYLYQAFLKNYGCTPKDYQRLHKPMAATRKYRSLQSSETFYTIENIIVVLEQLHQQALSVLQNLHSSLFSS